MKKEKLEGLRQKYKAGSWESDEVFDCIADDLMSGRRHLTTTPYRDEKIKILAMQKHFSKSLVKNTGRKLTVREKIKSFINLYRNGTARMDSKYSYKWMVKQLFKKRNLKNEQFKY